MSQKDKSDGGLKLTVTVPSSDNFDSTFELTTRHDNDSVEIRLGGQNERKFKVKKTDFLRSISYIFPDAINRGYVNMVEAKHDRGVGASSQPMPGGGGLLSLIFGPNGLSGANPGPGPDFNIFRIEPEEDEDNNNK